MDKMKRSFVSRLGHSFKNEHLRSGAGALVVQFSMSMINERAPSERQFGRDELLPASSTINNPIQLLLARPRAARGLWQAGWLAGWLADRPASRPIPQPGSRPLGCAENRLGAARGEQ